MLGERFEPCLERAQHGDADGFAELWRDAHPMLLRYLTVSSGAEAEDLASQTWLRVLGSLPSFEGNEPQFRRWLVTIARNLAVDGARAAGRRPELLVAELADSQSVVAPDAGNEADDRMSTRAAIALVARLPAAPAEMVMLRVVMGLEVADVAAVVGKSPGAVRVAVHRGLRALQELLRADDPGSVTLEHPQTSLEHDA